MIKEFRRGQPILKVVSSSVGFIEPLAPTKVASFFDLALPWF